LFEAGDIDGLSQAIIMLTTDKDRRHIMGEAALQRAGDDFATERLVQAWLNYYDGLQ